MTKMNNTSLHEEFEAPIKADTEALRKKCKATKEAEAILTSYLLGILGKNFQKTTNNTNNSSAIPLSQTDKTEPGTCRKVNRDTGAALNSMTGENNKKIAVEEISADDVCDNCGAEPSDIESMTRECRTSHDLENRGVEKKNVAKIKDGSKYYARIKKRFPESSLTVDERDALEAICRRNKGEVLIWKRARSMLILDSGRDPEFVCGALDIAPSVLTRWCRTFSTQGLKFFSLKDYSQREGYLSIAQEEALKRHFTDHPPLTAAEIRAYILAKYSQNYSTSGVIKLMKRLNFVHKKPIALATQADEAEQRKHIEGYERLQSSLLPSEIVLHLDAVHPEYQSRPAHGWFRKGQKVAIKTTSGRQRLNLHGAINLENRDLTIIKADTINAVSFRKLLEKIEEDNPKVSKIYAIVDNASYHRAKKLKAWLKRPERRVKLIFLPPYAPHLNAIERLWGLMHEWDTHNKYYDTFEAFTAAIFEFFEKTLPENWETFRDTITDNYRVISTKQYKIVWTKGRPDKIHLCVI